jgi:hypothetical protein
VRNAAFFASARIDACLDQILSERAFSRVGEEENVPYSKFDSATRELLCRVHHAASLQLEPLDNFVGAETRALHIAQLTRQLLAAVDSGERDFQRLMALALKGI